MIEKLDHICVRFLNSLQVVAVVVVVISIIQYFNI